jgi:ABC-type oligopeptide transport system ATPase subunit
MNDPLLTVDNLYVSFSKGRNTVQAVAGVSFTLYEGETLGLVGESGCGKSTTGRAIIQVEKASSGTITFGTTELTSLSREDLRTLRTQVQMIFQDPISSLNPRRRSTPSSIRSASTRTSPAVAAHVSSPAANANASASPALSSSNPSCWSATRSSPPWTSPCRRRSSTCWRT